MRLEKGLLGDILGIFEIAQEALTQPEDSRPMLVDELAECRRIALAASGQEVEFLGGIHTMPRSIRHPPPRKSSVRPNFQTGADD